MSNPMIILPKELSSVACVHETYFSIVCSSIEVVNKTFCQIILHRKDIQLTSGTYYIRFEYNLLLISYISSTLFVVRVPCNLYFETVLTCLYM